LLTKAFTLLPVHYLLLVSENTALADHTSTVVISVTLSIVCTVCNCVCVEGSMTASDTLTWLKTHGTAIDNTSFVTSMLSSGQKVVLTGNSLSVSDIVYVHHNTTQC